MNNIFENDLKDIYLNTKNEILNRNNNLTKIIIYKNYDIYEYMYSAKSETLILKE